MLEVFDAHAQRLCQPPGGPRARHAAQPLEVGDGVGRHPGPCRKLALAHPAFLPYPLESLHQGHRGTVPGEPSARTRTVRAPGQAGAGGSPLFGVGLIGLPEPSEGETIHEEEQRMSTETRPDYAGHARKEIGEMEEKRGLVAAELAETKAEPQDGALGCGITPGRGEGGS